MWTDVQPAGLQFQQAPPGRKTSLSALDGASSDPRPITRPRLEEADPVLGHAVGDLAWTDHDAP